MRIFAFNYKSVWLYINYLKHSTKRERKTRSWKEIWERWPPRSCFINNKNVRCCQDVSEAVAPISISSDFFLLLVLIRLAASANFPLIRRKIHYPRRKLTFPFNQTGPPMALDSTALWALPQNGNWMSSN